MNKILSTALAGVLLAFPASAADLAGRTLNIGSDTTYPPHEFIEDGVVKGFDVDVVAEADTYWNLSTLQIILKIKNLFLYLTIVRIFMGQKALRGPIIWLLKQVFIGCITAMRRRQKHSIRK